MKYEDILRRVSEDPILKAAIESMALQNGVVNLVSNHWEKILKNNITYQDLKNGQIPFADVHQKTHIKMQWMKGYNMSFPILVVGSFCLNKDEKENVSLISRDCPPLDKIYAAMMRQPPSENIQNIPHKFGIPACNKTFCLSCTSIEEKCQKMNISLKNHWCVRKNKIFNGERLKNLLEANVSKEFGRSEYLAIASISIRGRYYYGDNFHQSKLFGVVKDIILFKEQVFHDTDLNIDFPEEMDESPSLLENFNKDETVNTLGPINIVGFQHYEETPIDAVPRGLKRSRYNNDEDEDGCKWDIDWKRVK